ncbi:RNase H family protein [Pseudoalteromonas marina]|uniref:RNase H family protein n=1 Tax=Pseudoalteromonas marina TaxID=267375 RepID=A0ABT9FG84_9GAMM|nr:RNase H family protein [Pseudoalteromonas marina]MDP2565798.1 RNase H family protein [Pseudoalteromonas marina]
MFKPKKQHYILFISSYILSNPGPGAWAAELYKDTSDEVITVQTYNNFYSSTTVNYLELHAIIAGIKVVKPHNKLTIVHKSAYLNNVLTKWIFQWKSREFKTTNKKHIKHHKEIQHLNELMNSHKDVEVIYVEKETPVFTTLCKLNAQKVVLEKVKKKPPIQIINQLTKRK